MQAHGVLSLQEAIQHKDQQLNEAYQVSLEAEMRAHAQEAAIGALETDNHLLSAKSCEYQESASYYKSQWENVSVELEVSQQNLLLARDQIQSQQQTIHALNNELLRVAPDSPRKVRKRVHDDDDSKEELKEELAEQQKKYDRLQRECGKYQKDLSEFDRLRTRARDLEGQNRFLSEKVGSLTHGLLDLESQISAYVRDLDLLRSQNTRLLATAPSKTPQKPSAYRLRTPIKTPTKQRHFSPMSPMSPTTPPWTPIKGDDGTDADSSSNVNALTESDLFAFRAFEEQLDAIDEASDEDTHYGAESLHTSLIVQHHLDHGEWMRHSREEADRVFEADGIGEHSLFPQFFHIDDDAASLPSLEGSMTGSLASKASSMNTEDLNGSLLDRIKQTVNNFF